MLLQLTQAQHLFWCRSSTVGHLLIILSIVQLIHDSFSLSSVAGIRNVLIRIHIRSCMDPDANSTSFNGTFWVTKYLWQPINVHLSLPNLIFNVKPPHKVQIRIRGTMIWILGSGSTSLLLLHRCSHVSMRSQEKEMLKELNQQHLDILARRQDKNHFEPKPNPPWCGPIWSTKL